MDDIYIVGFGADVVGLWLYVLTENIIILIVLTIIAAMLPMVKLLINK